MIDINLNNAFWLSNLPRVTEDEIRRHDHEPFEPGIYLELRGERIAQFYIIEPPLGPTIVSGMTGEWFRNAVTEAQDLGLETQGLAIISEERTRNTELGLCGGASA